jgi:hypothetical protein
MDMLIANAQVNILITFQATGLKLKLLNTLFNGRWVLVNPEMLAGTGLDELCSVATNAAEIKSKILELFETEYDISQSFERAEILHSRFSDEVNSKKLIEKIWGKA